MAVIGTPRCGFSLWLLGLPHGMVAVPRVSTPKKAMLARLLWPNRGHNVSLLQESQLCLDLSVEVPL